MVVGSIIATGEERGERGGGKEDIHVLLTEWRRKIKRKMHARTQGQGMETNPLHALRTGVSVARCNLHMLINNTIYSPSCLRFAWVTARKIGTNNKGSLGAVVAPKT